MLPILLNLHGRLCVVVGGGTVGRRKARKLLDGGARVRVVCREEPPEAMAGVPVEWVTALYHPGHLEGAALVVAAATPEVNAGVIEDARARGILVNAAADPTAGDVFFPAVLRRGDLTVAVSTHGTAPALAAGVCELIGDQLGAALEEWVRLVAEFRAELTGRVPDAAARHELLRKLCDPGWLELLEREGVAAARAGMARVVGEVAGGPAAPV